MRKNRNVYIFGEKVVLVPYKVEHVKKYHEWMKSDELRRLTASEALSLEDEYLMQRTWLEDEDKCTFILLNGTTYRQTDNEIESMVGDTNLFLNESDGFRKGEIEIMIAEMNLRGKGFGKEALLLMLRYGIEELRIKTFVAKIGYSNTASKSLFAKTGFVQVSKSDVFHEETLELTITDSWYQWLVSNTSTHSRIERQDTSSEGITAL
uniref:N-acetyltransferase 9-like protein n=1 Tax=Strigamia maritima TaxID=126957 RepID=T1JLQ3_STRMM